MSIGQRIRTARAARGIKARWVAEQLGVAPETLSRWENGHAQPNAASVVKLGTLLGWTPEEIVEALGEST